LFHRPSFEKTFLDLAEVWAKRSTCNRLNTGCVLVSDDNQLITSGYNGSPRGLPHCDDVGHLMIDGHCVRTIHGEHNAVLQAARTGVSIHGATAYVLHRPCLRCTLMLVQAGIKKIVYRYPYEVHNDIDYVAEVTMQAGVEIRQESIE
jgi:dCMP deaminase